MAKLSSLLKLRGTRFSPTRRDGAAADGQAAAHGQVGQRRSGMAKALARFKRQRVAEHVEMSVVVSNEAKLTSVEALQPGNGSGVYIVERQDDARPHNDARRTKKMNPLLEQVTLVVYGWHNVEPGTLSWVFPSVSAAVAAARAMKNAV